MESLNKMLEWATTRRTLFSMDISSSELLTLTKETGGESALNSNAMSHELLLLYRPRELLRFCPVFLQTVFFKHLRILSFVLQIAPPEHYKNTNLTIEIFTELFLVHFQTLFHTLIFFLDCFNNIFFDFFVCFSIVWNKNSFELFSILVLTLLPESLILPFNSNLLIFWSSIFSSTPVFWPKFAVQHALPLAWKVRMLSHTNCYLFCHYFYSSKTKQIILVFQKTKWVYMDNIEW